MRIAIGTFFHETNAFCNVLVDQKTIDEVASEGQRIIDEDGKVHSYIGGFVAEAKEQGVELVASRAVRLKPSGPIYTDVFEKNRDRLVECLKKEYEKEPFDGICLGLHGACHVDGYPDPEGEILRCIREVFGKDMPITVALDLHGNITPEMLELADALDGVKSYPHVDQYDVGRVAMKQVCDIVRTGERPGKALIKLPWLMVPAEGVTTSGPACRVREYMLELEKEDPELYYASFFQGFPYTDVPSAGVSVVTVAKTQAAAEKYADKIARYAWDMRGEFTAPRYSAEQAMDIALSMGEGPILVHESSDNPGGGTPGDGTHLLREILKRNVPSAFTNIYDPEVVELAVKAGVGGRITCDLGAKTDCLHGTPIHLENAYVKCISDGRVVRKSDLGRGARSCYGLTVCLEVGNVSIVVVSAFRTQTFDDGPFRMAGLEWEDKQIVALKSAQHFKAYWHDKVKGIVPCESPGVMSADLATFAFKYTNTEQYPMKDVQWK